MTNLYWLQGGSWLVPYSATQSDSEATPVHASQSALYQQPHSPQATLPGTPTCVLLIAPRHKAPVAVVAAVHAHGLYADGVLLLHPPDVLHALLPPQLLSRRVLRIHGQKVGLQRARVLW